MKKITDIIETRYRTVYIKDAYGNRHRDQEEYLARRTVKTVSSGPRFGHFIIDAIFYNILLQTFSYFFALIIQLIDINAMFLLNLNILFFYILISVLSYPIYYGFFEYIWQKTPGKILTKTTVINEYGQKPDLRQIILRSMLRLVPFEAFSCFGNYSRGWHDKWSETYVVPDAELAEIKRLFEDKNTNFDD